MNDEKFDRVVVIIALLFAAYLLIKPSASATLSSAPPEVGGIPTPEVQAFAANPSAFMPSSLGNINVNIGNQGLSYLSNQYIPLFGFVGMAQGVYFQ